MSEMYQRPGLPDPAWTKVRWVHWFRSKFAPYRLPEAEAEFDDQLSDGRLVLVPTVATTVAVASVASAATEATSKNFPTQLPIAAYFEPCDHEAAAALIDDIRRRPDGSFVVSWKAGGTSLFTSTADARAELRRREAQDPPITGAVERLRTALAEHAERKSEYPVSVATVDLATVLDCYDELLRRAVRLRDALQAEREKSVDYWQHLRSVCDRCERAEKSLAEALQGERRLASDAYAALYAQQAATDTISTQLLALALSAAFQVWIDPHDWPAIDGMPCRRCGVDAAHSTKACKPRGAPGHRIRQLAAFGATQWTGS